MERAAVASGAKAGEALDRTNEALDRIKLSALSLGRISEDVSRSAENVKQTVVRETARVYRELEALENLHAMISVTRPVPSIRQWGTSADAVLALVELLRSTQPALVTVCGNAVSALWAALAAQQFGIDTRIVVLQHDEQSAQSARQLLAAHGVAGRVEVRHAPLETFDLNGDVHEWYGRQAFVDLQQIDLLFACGPLAGSVPDLRFPALPVLAGQLADGGVVLLDESDKTDYLEIVDQWLARIPGLTRDHFTANPGISLLRVRRSIAGSTPVRSLPAPQEPRTPARGIESPIV
jgi:predicted O-methyltransferase YrrM